MTRPTHPREAFAGIHRNPASDELCQLAARYRQEKDDLTPREREADLREIAHASIDAKFHREQGAENYPRTTRAGKMPELSLRSQEYTPRQLERLAAEVWRRMTAGDGYQQFGYDRPTLAMTHPRWLVIIDAMERVYIDAKATHDAEEDAANELPYAPNQLSHY